MAECKITKWLGRIAPAKMPAFIHVPKTGGTYLMQLESDAAAVVDGVRSFGHSYVVDDEQSLNPIYRHNPKQARETVVPRPIAENHFLFSTVRNIFSWLVSYASHAGGWNSRYDASRHYDHASAQKGFDYLVRTIADREEQWPNRKLIHCQLFSSGTDLIVHHINHQEVLDADLEAMAGRLGIPYQKKMPQRLGTTRDYREYYSDDLIELVGTTWNRELQLFGYTFGGCDRQRAIIKGPVSAAQKAAIKYCLKKDELTVNGKELPRLERAAFSVF